MVNTGRLGEESEDDRPRDRTPADIKNEVTRRNSDARVRELAPNGNKWTENDLWQDLYVPAALASYEKALESGDKFDIGRALSIVRSEIARLPGTRRDYLTRRIPMRASAIPTPHLNEGQACGDATDPTRSAGQEGRSAQEKEIGMPASKEACLIVAAEFTDDTELQEEIGNLGSGDIRSPETVKRLGAVQKDGRVKKQGLYKALLGAGAAAPSTPTPGAEGAAKGGRKAKATGEKKEMTKRGGGAPPAAPKTARADGFSLTKEAAAEQKVVVPCGILWRLGSHIYRMHQIMREWLTVKEISAAIPELASSARYVAELAKGAKLNPYGWVFETRKQGEVEQVRIAPDPAFVIQAGSDIWV